jgi:hypothetical protein
MNILGWIIWACGVLVLANQFPFAYFSKDGGIRILAKRYSILIITGLLVTALTDISRFHLLWWVPSSYFLNLWYFHWTAFRKQNQYIDSTTPEVGRGIKWVDITRQVFRILDFDRNGTIIGENDKVIAASSNKPYGYLKVEAPILNQPIKLPIIHRDDFLLASSVFDDPDLLASARDSDFLVTYAPKHKLEPVPTAI